MIRNLGYKVASFREFDELDDEAIICYPSMLYYALARSIALDESVLHDAFHHGENLDCQVYDMLCIYDIVDYYTKKSGCSVTALAEKINTKGFGKSTLYKLLMDPGHGITPKQFLVISNALGIPDKWHRFCLLRFGHKETSVSYLSGYEDCLQEFAEHPEDMEFKHDMVLVHKSRYEHFKNEAERLSSVVSAYEKIASETTKNLFHEIYKNLGYKFSTALPNSRDMDEAGKTRHQNAALSVTGPDGSMHTLETKDYEELLAAVIKYAKYLMDDSFK